MRKLMKRFRDNESGAISLEWGLVGALAALALYNVLSDNNAQEIADKRLRVVAQKEQWVKAIRARYGAVGLTEDSATIADKVQQTSLPVDTVRDYATDDFEHALGGAIDPTLNGDATFTLGFDDFSDEDCGWFLGALKTEMDQKRLGSLAVNGAAVTSIGATTANSTCTGDANDFDMTYRIN